MKKIVKILIIISIITTTLLYMTGCGGSVTGKYYREFGEYTSSTMYIELKGDNTYQSDGSTSGLWSKGTYEINGTEITFMGESAWLDALENADGVSVGSISGKTIIVNGDTYKK